MSSQIQTILLLCALVFAGAGFALGFYFNVRKVSQLEDKVARLKRTIRHLQDKGQASDRRPRVAAANAGGRQRPA